jgi:L-Lysine epsilon oxidase N-terminal/Iron-containing redox enzyme/L-lysine epsilon oxidase C-terminal domain
VIKDAAMVGSDGAVPMRQAHAWKIHPAIGIARVGNSPTAFFTGPGAPSNGHRDAGDAENLHLPRIKREAAQFHIFAYDEAGHCLGEITCDAVKAIAWTVELANKKASGHRIGGDRRAGAARRRNKSVPAGERWKLEITPRPRQLVGAGQRAVFDDGRFMDVPACLGEIRTDGAGRLQVLGGLGKAGTHDAAKRIKSFTDNDGWYDDIADGPVSAKITLPDGRVVAAEPAWVVVTPPNFAPGFASVATLHDMLVDRAIAAGKRRVTSRPSFQRDILPILNRIAAMQWLNRRVLGAFGIGGETFDLAAGIAVLAESGPEAKPARERVFHEISRHDAIAQAEGPERPPLAERWLRLTRTQRDALRLWAAGQFDSDGSVDAPVAPAPLSPEALDRAALDSCAGGLLPATSGPDIFLPGESFRLDPARLAPGALTAGMACPWQADFLEGSAPWSPSLPPAEVLTQETLKELRDLDARIASLPDDGSESEQRESLRERRRALWHTRKPWARALAAASPAREESLVKEWQHLGFVAACGGDGATCYVETERNPCLGTMADYFHRLVNIESNRDFTPKALELAMQVLDDAKFSVDAKFAPFPYTPEAFDAHLDRIYADFVDTVMYKPVRWESGDILWDAVVDYDEDGEPVRKERVFHVGRFSDRALAERFRQFAPLNLTDGAWLQNILAAGPVDDVKSRLFAIWCDEAGNGRRELNHSNVYDTLLRSLNIYMPPVTSRDFVEQDLVRSSFESSVFQLSVGLFPQRFLPELLGMTLFVEWEATPTMQAIAKMMADRHIDPQYYRMHAAIDNINVGHGALAKEAIKLYLHGQHEKGGDAAVQEHWRRIWRAYVAWSTLGNGADEVLERMMLVDKKQIHVESSLLAAADILPPFVAALRAGGDPLSFHLRGRLSLATQALLRSSSAAASPSQVLLEGLSRDVNACLKAGLYDRERFRDVNLSPATKTLVALEPKHGVDLVDLGRCLLEDAYPDGIARRSGFPDIKRHYAARMVELIRRKTQLALQSHRRVGWLMHAFEAGPETVMRALVDQGLIDIDHPAHSRLFEKFQFSGPMYKVFSEDEKTTLVDWIESLRADGAEVARPEPAALAEPIPGVVERLERRAADGALAWPRVIAGEPAQPAERARPFGDKRGRIGMGSTH